MVPEYIRKCCQDCSQNFLPEVTRGLPEAKWEEKKMEMQKQEGQYPSHESRQRTLSEFMS
jgi:hypothetical protein